MKLMILLSLIALLCAGSKASAGEGDLPAGMQLPPLPVLPPSALTGDPGDGRAYLRWNLQLEDERVVGWKVMQLAPENRLLTPNILTNPSYVAANLQNGKSYRFAVFAVLKDGSKSPLSNAVALTPRDVGVAKIQQIERRQKVTVGEFEDIELTGKGCRVIFPDGQELLYDNYRPVDWKTANGEHLLYPKVFGNGLDIGKFEQNGLPRVIPPEGLKAGAPPAGEENWRQSGNDFFTVRWTGQVMPRHSEQYHFYTITDDGVRLWVDGKMLIDQWHPQGGTEHRGRIKLEAGKKYDIKMEYYENTGGATAKLMWSSDSQPKEIIPASQLFPPNSEAQEGSGLLGEYFDSLDFTNRKIQRVDPVVNFNWGNDGPIQAKPDYYYADAQHGVLHPYITDPLTLSTQQSHHDARDRWFEPEVDGNRVTFHWWQPMKAMGYRSWIYVLVWETWWPTEKELHGTTYRGLARHIEVQMPDALRDGYQVMLNNGFGPGGTRNGVKSYSSGFSRPTHKIVDFSGDTNRQAFRIRTGSYHPKSDSLQSNPLIFYDWGTGSMLITARSLYYHCPRASSSYIEQGIDGVWPNLAWDMAIAGEKTPVDTVEYLYAADTSQPLPQRYINARMDALAAVSERMGVQDDLAAVSVNGTLGDIKRSGGPVEYARKRIDQVNGTGVDGQHVFHDIWHAVPITVDDAYRLDPNHDSNPELRAMCNEFHKAGYSVGFWFRPEFTKTAIVNVLSRTIPTAEAYYGYSNAHYPEVVDLLHERGIPILRHNLGWIRLQRDGSFPVGTPYQWVPMSLATDWWNRIMWPTLKMSRELGFDWILMDGGFGGMQGVDYAPMLAGRANGAVACQPYWWRMFRSMQHIGIRLFGECTVGWKGGFVNLTGPGDENYIWFYTASTIWGNQNLNTPELLHKVFQLYNATSGRRPEGLEKVSKYAITFYKEHSAPDWIELKDLRQLDAREIEERTLAAPVAGGVEKPAEEREGVQTIRPWVWGDVIWHYNDGSQVVYPAFDEIDWENVK